MEKKEEMVKEQPKKSKMVIMQKIPCHFCVERLKLK